MSNKALAAGEDVLWYTIREVIGVGGFGITYLAQDQNLDRAVAIKEYFPAPYASRQRDFTVEPVTAEHGDSFSWGLQNFKKEAQTLAKFRHDNIVRVYSVFDANNTAYMVMEYEYGENLKSTYRKQIKTINQNYFEEIFFPIFDGLKQIHEFGFIHRDIKPSNIYIRGNGTPVLIDFGSARQTSQQRTDEMTTLVSKGYTPLEQYSVNYGDQGPWTDIYSLSATLYEGITGKKPEDALSRSACLLRQVPDSVQPLLNDKHTGFTQRFLDAIGSGLLLKPEARPSDLSTWLLQFRDKSDRYQNDKTDVVVVQSDNMSIPTLHANANDLVSSLQPDSQQNEPQLDSNQSPVDFDEDFYLSHDELDDTYLAEIITDLPELPDEPINQDVSERLDIPEKLEIPESNETAEHLDSLHLDPDPTERLRVKKNPYKSKMALVSIAVLVALSGVGFYGLLLHSDDTEALDFQSLDHLSRPDSPITIVLPRERVLDELDEMLRLSSVLQLAFEENKSDPQLLDRSEELYEILSSYATQWHPSRYPEIRIAIDNIVETFVEESKKDQFYSALTNEDISLEKLTYVKELLESGKYISPIGGSVLDEVSRLSKTDFSNLVKAPQWQAMMNSFEETALERLKKKDFAAVAQVIEVALSLDPENISMNDIRDFLNHKYDHS